MRIATFTDHIHTPSSRFRIRQYFPELEANGISINDYHRKLSTEAAAAKNGTQRIRESLPLLARAVTYELGNILLRLYESIESNNYDAVWLSRQLIIGYPSFELLIRKPIVYDIDDAIFLCGKGANVQFKILAERASTVIAGNDFLAECAAKHSKRVVVIPTTVDTRRWRPLAKENHQRNSQSRIFKVGWSGTSSSFSYFIPIENEIEKFLCDFPSVRLTMMSDRPPRELVRLRRYIEFVKWSPTNEVSFVQSLDIGLMPTDNQPWSRGKCAYKMLLYAACGVPVIVTPTGMNLKILAEAEVGFGVNRLGEWYEAMHALYLDYQTRRRFGDNGLRLVRDRYSVEKYAPEILEILRQCR
jgi:glycosyltransferase involved in cell wall biosynthesis